MGKSAIERIVPKGAVVLAPMAGIADAAMRTVCVRHGAEVTYSEMVSAAGLVYGSSRSHSHEIALPAPEEKRFALQLFGSDPSLITEAIQLLEERLGDRIDFYDLNMGCPVAKVVKKGEGCALMRDTALATAIVNAAVEASDKPVSVKFRSGWTEPDINALEFGRAMEAAGASALCLHPRTRGQLYRGRADRDLIGHLVESVSIPVLGSGDVFTPEDAREMFEDEGVWAVMVARGAKGDPWIFERIAAHLAGEPLPETPSIKELFSTIRDHADLAIDLFGERVAVPRMRKHIAWYVHGLPEAAEMRREASRITIAAELYMTLREFEERVAGCR